MAPSISKHGRKDEAAVIAGIVFEDTVRRICRVLGLPEERGRAHNGTWEAGCYDRGGGEAARAAAGLRTSAAGACGRIKIGDVDPVIQFTRGLMWTHLS